MRLKRSCLRRQTQGEETQQRGSDSQLIGAFYTKLAPDVKRSLSSRKV